MGDGGWGRRDDSHGLIEERIGCDAREFLEVTEVSGEG